MDSTELLKLLLSGVTCGGVTLLFMRLYYAQCNKTQEAIIQLLTDRLDAIEERLKTLERTAHEDRRKWEEKVSHKACSEFRSIEKQMNDKQFQSLTSQLSKIEDKLDTIIFERTKKAG